jgi:hypothetical protein
MNADVLTRVCAEIDARLIKLRPALAEYQRLLDAEQALVSRAERAQAAEAKRVLAADAKRALAADAKRARAAQAATSSASATKKRESSRASARPRAGRAAAPSSPRRGRRGSAAGTIERAPSRPRGASQQAIVAALEHGSHTLGELAVVTAISSSEIRESVRQLQRAGTIARTRREGRVAYALLVPAVG